MKGLTTVKTILSIVAVTTILNSCIDIRVENSESDKKTAVELKQYGKYAKEIEKLLDATPVGSEISLEEIGNGELRLRIEKIYSMEEKKSEIEVEEKIIIDNKGTQEHKSDISPYDDNKITI